MKKWATSNTGGITRFHKAKHGKIESLPHITDSMKRFWAAVHMDEGSDNKDAIEN